MSHYKPYPAYKDSGVEWIGQVPEYWQIAQLKRLVSIQNGSDHKAIETDEGYPVYGSGGRFAYASSYMHDGESVLLGRKGTIDRPMYVNGRFWTVDTMYWTKILANADGKFFYYAATTIPFSYYATNTALPSMTQTSLGAHLMAYPPLEEQSTIAATLDRETARIDALIGKKTRFIELLKEKRQALITHAVTKGLDPNVKMKDSGVEWIGQVPEHWEVKPICRVTSVNDDALSDSTTGSTRISYVDISSVGYTEGIKQATEMAFEDAPSRARRKASTGDVVVSTVRTYLKAVAAVTDEYADCIFSTGFAVLRARQLEQSFLKWMILNELLIQSIEAHSEGLSYPAINASALVKLKSVIPPPEEQATIAAALDRETARIDALIGKAEHSITLLKERRAAFITAAVTGQIDLRGEQ